MQETEWWRKPVRMMRRDYNSDFGQLLRADLNQLAREARERWHINFEWMMATPGASPGTAHLTTFNTPKFEKMPGMGDFDLIRSYLPHARKYGIKLVPYVNMHWFSYDFAKKHPGWEQLLEDGTAYGVKNPLYGNGTTLCINSGWRDFAFDMIREVIKTGADGCFLDGPVAFPGACYCETCRRLFAKMTGQKKLPSFNDWSDPWFRHFLQFRSNSMIRFLRDAQRAVTEINPDGVIFLNGGHYSTYDCIYGREPEGLEEFQNFTGAEEFFHCTQSYISPYRSLHLSRFLSAGKKPGVVFTHHALSTWHYNPLCAPEMKTALAQTVAGGSNPWFAIFMDSMKTRARESFEGVENIHRFLEEQEKYIAGTTSAADVAVLTSRKTLNNYISRLKGISKDIGSGREENLVQERGTGKLRADFAGMRKASEEIINGEYEGCFDALTYSHVPLRVVWDKYLAADSLKRVKVLIAPNPACLSGAQLKILAGYVHGGGNLIVTFEGGFYDEWGRPSVRKTWLKFLGIKQIEGVFAPSRTEDYLTITSDKLPSFAKGLMMPRTYHALKIVPEPDAQVLAKFNEPVGMSYQKLAGISKYPAIMSVKRGKGKVIYVCAPLFETYKKFSINDHLRLIDSLVRMAYGPDRQLLVETNAPGSLAVELRNNKSGLMLHLVNVTGDMKRPMGAIVPLRDIEISVKVNKVKCRNVTSLSSGRNLRFKKKNGRVTFIVPKINEYEIVVLK